MASNASLALFVRGIKYVLKKTHVKSSAITFAEGFENENTRTKFIRNLYQNYFERENGGASMSLVEKI